MTGKPYPIDLATWEVILKSLDAEVAKMSSWPRTKGEVRTQALEFYNSALEEFRAFKDAWRNHIMHSRRSYIAADATQVMEHVRRHRPRWRPEYPRAIGRPGCGAGRNCVKMPFKNSATVISKLVANISTKLRCGSRLPFSISDMCERFTPEISARYA